MFKAIPNFSAADPGHADGHHEPIAVELYHARYSVLQMMARKFPEPVAQCIHVYVSALRSMLLSVVPYVMARAHKGMDMLVVFNHDYV